jgi:hypothetical protein
MGALAEIYVKIETLEKIVQVLRKKQEKGIGITVSINDKSNNYGSNVSAFVTQSKEDREAKKEKFSVGFGKVFWTDGKIVKGEKPVDEVKNIIDDLQEGSLPF